jgi:hypothetical protein
MKNQTLAKIIRAWGKPDYPTILRATAFERMADSLEQTGRV